MLNTMYAKFAEVNGDTVETRMEFNYCILRDLYYSNIEELESFKTKAKAFMEPHAYMNNVKLRGKWVELTNKFIDETLNHLAVTVLTNKITEGLSLTVKEAIEEAFLKIATA